MKRHEIACVVVRPAISGSFCAKASPRYLWCQEVPKAAIEVHEHTCSIDTIGPRRMRMDRSDRPAFPSEEAPCRAALKRNSLPDRHSALPGLRRKMK